MSEPDAPCEDEVLYIPRQAYEAMLAADNPAWPDANKCPVLFQALVNQKLADSGR